MEALREFVTQSPWSALFAIVFVFGGAILAAVINELGMPRLVGLIMGKVYREAKAKREAEAEARGRAFAETERLQREAKKKKEAAALERARAFNRQQREHVHRLMRQREESKTKAPPTGNP